MLKTMHVLDSYSLKNYLIFYFAPQSFTHAFQKHLLSFHIKKTSKLY